MTDRRTARPPKRRRRTRRELPYGQTSLWGATVGNFRRERERALRVFDRVAMTDPTEWSYR